MWFFGSNHSFLSLPQSVVTGDVVRGVTGGVVVGLGPPPVCKQSDNMQYRVGYR